MLLDASQAQLVLVDYQVRLMPAIFDGSMVLANAVRLGKLARLMGVPTWGTEQNPAKLGNNVAELKELCGRTIGKMRFSAVQEGLMPCLRPPRSSAVGNARSIPERVRGGGTPSPLRNSIVVAGCEAHVCLLQTALELIESDFDVWVVTDACGSRAERNRDAAFDRLVGAGAELVTTEMVAFEWLQSAQHPAFRAVQALIK